MAVLKSISLVLLIIFFMKEKWSCFELNIIHTNDFHARYEPTSVEETICEKNCSGGFSRMYEMIRTLRASRNHSLVLNAGDNSQGTIWHTQYGWNVTHHFLNLIKYDAMTLGNHDFDDGIGNLSKLLTGLKSHVVCANVVSKDEPRLKGLVHSRATVKVGGKKIGLVGVVTRTTAVQVRSVGRIKFLNEIDAVNAEATKLMAEGCFTVVVLSHVGYEEDLKMAKKAVAGISVIVGGHTHTLLYNGTPPFKKSLGDYPTVVHKHGKEPVLVVQTYCCSYYVGNLSVRYKENGTVFKWEGNPIFLSEDLPQNEKINKDIERWRKGLKKSFGKVLCSNSKEMDNESCRKGECLLGNLMAEAMANYWIEGGKKHYKERCSPIALIQAFGLRSTLPQGEVTYADLLEAMPFSNNIKLGRLKGKYIWEAMEKSVSVFFPEKGKNILQQAGLRVLVNKTMPKGHQVHSVDVCCNSKDLQTCVPIDLDKSYYVTLPSFLTLGKDSFEMFKLHLKDVVDGPVDIKVVEKYIKRRCSHDHEPYLDGRIKTI